MLDGTDLSMAYSPMGAASFGNSMQDLASLIEPEEPPRKVERKPVAAKASPPPPAIPPALSQFVPQSQPPTQQVAAPRNTPLSQIMFDQQGGVLNKQFEQEQKIQLLVQELKKRKMAAAAPEEGYFEKLMNKKKDVLKFLQSGLIVLFAFSMHFVIDHYLKLYFQNNDVSFEREIFIRLLYPAAIVFLAWNLITFNK